MRTRTLYLPCIDVINLTLGFCMILALPMPGKAHSLATMPVQLLCQCSSQDQGCCELCTYRIPLYCILQIRSPSSPCADFIQATIRWCLMHVLWTWAYLYTANGGYFVAGQFCTSMCGTIFCFGMQLQICIAYHFLYMFPHMLCHFDHRAQQNNRVNRLASLLTSSSKAPTSDWVDFGGASMSMWIHGCIEHTCTSKRGVLASKIMCSSTSIPSENGVLSTSIVLSFNLYFYMRLCGDHTHDVSAVYVLSGWSSMNLMNAVNWVVPKQWWCDAGLQSLQWEGGDPMASWNHIHGDFWPRPSQPQWWSHCSCGHVHASWL